MRQDIGFTDRHSRVRGNPVFSRENGNPENEDFRWRGNKDLDSCFRRNDECHSRNRTKLLAIAIFDSSKLIDASFRRIPRSARDGMQFLQILLDGGLDASLAGVMDHDELYYGHRPKLLPKFLTFFRCPLSK